MCCHCLKMGSLWILTSACLRVMTSGCSACRGMRFPDIFYSREDTSYQEPLSEQETPSCNRDRLTRASPVVCNALQASRVSRLTARQGWACQVARWEVALQWQLHTTKPLRNRSLPILAATSASTACAIPPRTCTGEPSKSLLKALLMFNHQLPYGRH